MDIDTLTERTLIAIGAIFLVAGVAMMLSPDIAAGLPFGNGVISAIGILTLVLGLLAARSRLHGDFTETETPDPERPADNPIPGDDVDRMLYEMTHLRQGIDEVREELMSQLRWIGIAVIREREDCSEGEAARRLETGEWTDNDVAAEFFRSSSVDSEPTGYASFLAADSNTGEWERQFRETVEALIEVAEMDLPPAVRDQKAETSLLDSLFGGNDDDEAAETGVQSNWNVGDSTVASFDTTGPFEDVDVHRTNRWLGITGFGLLALGLGTFAASPGLMLVGAIAAVFTVYARLEAIPPLDNLEVERVLSETEPEPSDEVQVTVTIRNTGDTTLPDLRVIDVVPDEFVVSHGCPRHHTGLAPGASTTFQYTATVERGEHEWPLMVVGRDFSGGVERTSLITPDTSLVCSMSLVPARDAPVRSQTIQYTGDVSTSTGGSGLEFYSVREYQEGDPMNRINWSRVARTGELSTIDFRQEKAAKITLLFDTRQSAYASRASGNPHAVDLSVHAAGDVFAALYDAGNLVGVAAFDTVPCWLAPGAGSNHLERAKQLFTRHPALSARPPERQNAQEGHTIQGRYIDPMTHVRRRLPENSQIFLFSPLIDDYAGEVARRLNSMGHLVTVVSPDVTASETVGQRLTAIERTTRVRTLRERDIRVVDWDAAERLDLQLEKAKARWSQ